MHKIFSTIILFIFIFSGTLFLETMKVVIKDRFIKLKNVKFFEEIVFMLKNIYKSFSFKNFTDKVFLLYLSRLLLSIIPWFFLPLVNHKPIISSHLSFMYIATIIQLQLISELVISKYSSLVYNNILKYRNSTLYFMSYYLIVISAISIYLIFDSTDINEIAYSTTFSFYSFINSFVLLVAFMCKNGIGAFNVLDTPNKYKNVPTINKTFHIQKLYNSIDILFSCVFLTVCFFGENLIIGHDNLLKNIVTNFLFFSKLGIFIVIIYLVPILLLPLKIKHILSFFKIFLLPVSYFLILFSSYLKYFLSDM